jgi:DNA (cytosine-5)-methyltransferase 1
VKTFCDDIGVEFQSRAALDMNRDALRVYERNHGTKPRASESDNDWESHKGDVTKLVLGEWKKPKITKRVIDTHKEKGIDATSNDVWKNKLKTHRTNRTKYKNETISVRPTLSVKEIQAEYCEINKPIINPDGPWKDIKKGTIDLLLAGPPCQGHSNLNNHSRRDDHKNELYLVVPAVAFAWDIPLVIIENVEGVIHDVSGVVQQTEGLFNKNGYAVTRGVLAAHKMGWPQTRKRYFLIARKKGVPVPINEVMESFSIHDGEPLGVKHAIEDLKKKDWFTRDNEKKNVVTVGDTKHMFTVPKYSPKEAARANYHANKTKRGKLAAVKTLEKIFIKEGRLDKSVILENFKRAKEEIGKRSLQDLKDDHNLPTRLHNITHWEDTTYPTVYGRLSWDKPSGTITSGYMCSGRGRFTHPELPRTLTPIEAARLQGFPDSYDWKPENDRIPSATNIAQWIGDAVPMPLGYAAAYSALGNGLDFK